MEPQPTVHVVKLQLLGCVVGEPQGEFIVGQRPPA
jgi:hypothetical protein